MVATPVNKNEVIVINSERLHGEPRSYTRPATQQEMNNAAPSSSRSKNSTSNNNLPSSKKSITENYDLEKKQIESLTPEQAKEQGYEYSSAVGWYRIPATDKNIDIAKRELLNQREQISTLANTEVKSTGEEKRYFVDKKEVSKQEYVNYLANQQTRLSEQIQTLNTLRAANKQIQELKQQPQTNQRPNIQILTPGAVYPDQTQSKDNNSAIMKEVMKTQGTRTDIKGDFETRKLMQNQISMPTKYDISPEEKKTNAIRLHQEELSGISKGSLSLSAGIIQKTDEILAPADVIPSNFIKGLVKGAGSAIPYTAAGIIAIPATAEGLARHPEDIMSLGEIGASGIAQNIAEDPTGFAGNIIGTEIVLGGASKAVIKSKGAYRDYISEPESRITAFKLTDPEELILRNKDVKFSGGYEALVERTTKIDKILKKPPVEETLALNVIAEGKLTPKKFDIQTITVLGQEDISIARIKGSSKLQERNVDASYSIDTQFTKKTTELGRQTIRTDMDIFPAEISDKGITIKGTQGTKKTSVTKINYLKETNTGQFVKATVRDELLRYRARIVDDAFNQQYIPEGILRIQSVKAPNIEILTGRGTAKRAGKMSEFESIERPAALTKKASYEVKDQPMKPLEFGTGPESELNPGSGSSTIQALKEPKTKISKSADTLGIQLLGVREAGRTSALTMLEDTISKTKTKIRHPIQNNFGINDLFNSFAIGVSERLKIRGTTKQATQQQQKYRQDKSPLQLPPIPDILIEQRQTHIPRLKQIEISILEPGHITTQATRLKQPVPTKQPEQFPQIMPILPDIPIAPEIQKSKKPPRIPFGGSLSLDDTYFQNKTNTKTKTIEHNFTDILKLLS